MRNEVCNLLGAKAMDKMSHPEGPLPQRAEKSCPRQLKREKLVPHCGCGLFSWSWFEIMSSCWFSLTQRRTWSFQRRGISGDGQGNEDFRNPPHHGPLYSSGTLCLCLTWYKNICKNNWNFRLFIAYKSLCADFNGNGFSARTREFFFTNTFIRLECSLP